ncbi:hypothetical protein U1Q18_007424 [Sarracenia purpurea var. burkii]
MPSFYEMSRYMKLLIVAMFVVTAVTARPSPDSKPTTTMTAKTLMARLKVNDEEEGSSKCWDSLIQLQSCTGEVVLFFLNGETYLGPSCCTAIRIIENQCWPAMLGSIGFTSEEGGILRGYCDATTDSDADFSPPPPSLRTVGPDMNSSAASHNLKP